MSPILYVLLGLFGGVLLLGVVVAILVFFKYVQQMKESLEKLTAVLNALSKDNTLAESLDSFRELVNTGKAMMHRMDGLKTTIDLFYKVAVKTDQLMQEHPPAEVTPGSSEVYPYDEEAAARREVHRKLTSAGVEMPPDKEIPSDKAVGAQV